MHASMMRELERVGDAIAAKLAEGKTLREVNRWSWEAKKYGLIPYLHVADSDANGLPLRLAPSWVGPNWLVFRDVFDETAPGCKALPRYNLRVLLDAVILPERSERQGPPGVASRSMTRPTSLSQSSSETTIS